MKNFAIGLGVGLLGGILWVVTSAVVGEGPGAEPLPVLRTLMGIGFGLMFAGPLVWWIVLPVVNLVRGRKKNDQQLY